MYVKKSVDDTLHDDVLHFSLFYFSCFFKKRRVKANQVEVTTERGGTCFSLFLVWLERIFLDCNISDF